jgi:hypothetical protein
MLLIANVDVLLVHAQSMFKNCIGFCFCIQGSAFLVQSCSNITFADASHATEPDADIQMHDGRIY